MVILGVVERNSAGKKRENQQTERPYRTDRICHERNAVIQRQRGIGLRKKKMLVVGLLVASPTCIFK